MTPEKRLGTQGECHATAALLAKGYTVYKEVSGYGKPDLCAKPPVGRAVSVEVRVEAFNGEGSDPTRRRKKIGDDCDHYAWVNRDTAAVDFEPPLPTIH